MNENYMVLDCESPTHEEFTYYKRDNNSSNKSWWGGRAFGAPGEQSYKKLQHPVEPVEVTLDEDDPGVYAEYWEHPVPLMTKRLYSALTGAGVDNLQVYDAIIHDPFTGEDRTDYVAWNLVGTVSAVDLEKTDFDDSIPDRMISMDINSLAVDEAKAGGRLMFRLAESVNAILVHKKVIEAITAAGIDTLTFIPPANWAG